MGWGEREWGGVAGGVTLQLSWVKKRRSREKRRSENIQPCLISSVTGLTVVYIAENKQTTSKANGPLYGRTPNTPANGVGAGRNLDTLNGLRWNNTTDAGASFTI